VHTHLKPKINHSKFLDFRFAVGKTKPERGRNAPSFWLISNSKSGGRVAEEILQIPLPIAN